MTRKSIMVSTTTVAGQPVGLKSEQNAAISLYFKALAALEASGVIRSGRPAGDLGEFLAERAFGVDLVAQLRQRGYDALQDGNRVQIKLHNSPKGNNIEVGNPSEYDVLIVVIGPHSKLRSPDHGAGEFRCHA